MAHMLNVELMFNTFKSIRGQYVGLKWNIRTYVNELKIVCHVSFFQWIIYFIVILVFTMLRGQSFLYQIHSWIRCVILNEVLILTFNFILFLYKIAMFRLRNLSITWVICRESSYINYNYFIQDSFKYNLNQHQFVNQIKGRT